MAATRRARGCMAPLFLQGSVCEVDSRPRGSGVAKGNLCWAKQAERAAPTPV